MEDEEPEIDGATAAPVDLIHLPTDATSMQEAAEIYAQLGFAVVRLWGVSGSRCACNALDCPPRNAGKHPIPTNWQRTATSNADQAREVFRGHLGNIGIMLGSQLVVLDADGPTGLESLRSLGPLPETLTAVSGSGEGGHFVFRYAPHQDPMLVTNRSNILGPGSKLDVKTREGQMVVAPSLHLSGNRYRWVHPVMPALLPDSLYERIKRPAPAAASPAPLVSPSPDSETLITRARAYVDRIPGAVSGNGGHAQTFNAGRALAGWVRKGLSRSDGWALLCEYNQRCDPPWSDADLRHKWDEALTKSNTLPDLQDREPKHQTRQQAGASQSLASGSGTTAITPATQSDAIVKNWKSKLLWEQTKQGGMRPVKHLENALVVLKYHPDWIGRVRLNAHSHEATVTDPPWGETQSAGDHSGTKNWTDEDTSRLHSWIQREVNLNISVSDCERAVSVIAAANSFHPVQGWMSTLEWDGVPRLSEAPATYFGCESTPYTRLVLRWWMISAVARTFTPGEKADHVLILEGAQGLKKSTALRVLAGAEWFSDSPLDINSKDAFQSLPGKLIIELAELESLRRTDAARAKAFFSSPVDDYRRSYGKRNVKVLRQCVFAGTVNPEQYLSDPTGNRRYWPLKCIAIDIDAIERDRAQLWAEAVAAYQEGQPWYPVTDDERRLCGIEQGRRVETDEWEGTVRIWLQQRQISDRNFAPRLADVMNGALGLPSERQGRSEQTRAGNVMTAIGWRKIRRRVDGVPLWVYVPADCVAEHDDEAA